MDATPDKVSPEELTYLVGSIQSALMDILSRGAGEWGKLEIAAWLNGPYREVTRKAPESVGRPSIFTDRLNNDSCAPDLDARLGAVLSDARARVIATMEQAIRGEFHFAADALLANHVEEIEDTDGNFAYVPVDHARMPLADRITSLLAAIYLGQPAHYRSSFSICSCCGAVNFGQETQKRGQCAFHTSSGIREIPGVHRGTLIGLGQQAKAS